MPKKLHNDYIDEPLNVILVDTENKKTQEVDPAVEKSAKSILNKKKAKEEAVAGMDNKTSAMKKAKKNLPKKQRSHMKRSFYLKRRRPHERNLQQQRSHQKRSDKRKIFPRRRQGRR